MYTIMFYGIFIRLLLNGDRRLAELNRNIRNILPRIRFGIDSSKISLIRVFFAHSIRKQFLTDGAGYVMSFFNVITLADQGISENFVTHFYINHHF